MPAWRVVPNFGHVARARPVHHKAQGSQSGQHLEPLPSLSVCAQPGWPLNREQACAERRVAAVLHLTARPLACSPAYSAWLQSLPGQQARSQQPCMKPYMQTFFLGFAPRVFLLTISSNNRSVPALHPAYDVVYHLSLMPQRKAGMQLNISCPFYACPLPTPPETLQHRRQRCDLLCRSCCAAQRMGAQG